MPQYCRIAICFHEFLNFGKATVRVIKIQTFNQNIIVQLSPTQKPFDRLSLLKFIYITKFLKPSKKNVLKMSKLQWDAGKIVQCLII